MPAPNKPADDRKRKTEGSAAWLKYSGIAGVLIGTIGVCIGLGLWLDSTLGTSPWLTVVLSLIGVIGGLYASLKDLL